MICATLFQCSQVRRQATSLVTMAGVVLGSAQHVAYAAPPAPAPPVPNNNKGMDAGTALGLGILGGLIINEIAKPRPQQGGSGSNGGQNYQYQQQYQQPGYVEGQYYYLQDGRLAVFRAGQFVPVSTQPTTPAASNSQPKENATPPEPEVTPDPNSTEIRARRISEAEKREGLRKLREILLDAVETVESEGAEFFPNTTRLIAQLEEKGVPANIQAELLQQVAKGESAKVQITWATLLKDPQGGDSLFQQIELKNLIEELTDSALDETFSSADLGRIVKSVKRLSLAKKDEMAIISTTARMDEVLQMRELLETSVPASKGLMDLLPMGTTKILSSPKLPAGTLVSLGNGAVIAADPDGEYRIREASLAELYGWAVISERPITAVTKAEKSNSAVVQNPKRLNTPVFVTVDGTEYKLLPGESKSFPANQGGAQVSFNRGGSFGQKTYSLKPGTYEFRGTSEGWDLRQMKYSITLDNTDNSSPFHVVINGKKETLAAGASKEIDSMDSVIVAFDRADGRDVKKASLTNGRYRIGLSGTDGKWDLFSGEAADVAVDVQAAF